MDLISKELSECQHANLADYTVGINMQGAEASAVEANARLAIIDRKIKREPDEQETTLTKRSRPALHDQDPEDVADWENSQWTCHVCTFENDGSKTKCGMCSVKASIGHLGVWTLTTAKPGNGIHQLRDNSPDTYWQSDGATPHVISVSFEKKQSFYCVQVYLDYTLDESYTPKKISVGVGMCRDDLVGARCEVIEFSEPNGWVEICLGDVVEEVGVGMESFEDEEGNVKERRRVVKRRECPRGHLVQISVAAMHQNGRDTHIRQVRIFGPEGKNSAEQKGGGVRGVKGVPGCMPGVGGGSVKGKVEGRGVFGDNGGGEVNGVVLGSKDGVYGFRQARTTGYEFEDCPVVVGKEGSDDEDWGAMGGFTTMAIRKFDSIR